jgi:hypothetical protein
MILYAVLDVALRSLKLIALFGNTTMRLEVKLITSWSENAALIRITGLRLADALSFQHVNYFYTNTFLEISRVSHTALIS